MATQIITNILLFLSLYFEVFLLVTYIQNRNNIKKDKNNTSKFAEPKYYPTVSIIVPCWNEGKTLTKTVESLLALDYPKDRIDILLIDDGSTDNTWEVMQNFKDVPNIKIYKKENGGKHTVLNFGLEKSNSQMVGCLDADSYVQSDTLKNIILHYEEHTDLMAVAPSVKIFQPKNMLQKSQNVEYTLGVFMRKMLSFLEAMYVTPGPFSIFKREVFEKIGNYKHAYLTEDMEIAMRMQANHMKIGHAHKATVHTSSPDSLKKLYKQRLRWTYGFIKNAIDYRFIFFKADYGNLGIFVLPLAGLSILATLYSASQFISSLYTTIVNEIIQIQTVGFHFPVFNETFDWFYLNTTSLSIIGLMAVLGTVVILFISRSLATSDYERSLGRFTLDILCFMVVYTALAPIWMAKALYNAVFSVKTLWR